jgi:hypothetical protein
MASGSPIFAITPFLSDCVISTANTGRDGTGSTGTVATAESGGTRIDRVTVQALGNTSAGMVRLFLFDGDNTRLYKEIPVSAVAVSGTVAAFSEQLNNLGLVLPSGYSLKAATHNAESFAVFAEGGSY